MGRAILSPEVANNTPRLENTALACAATSWPVAIAVIAIPRPATNVAPILITAVSTADSRRGNAVRLKKPPLSTTQIVGPLFSLAT